VIIEYSGGLLDKHSTSTVGPSGRMPWYVSPMMGSRGSLPSSLCRLAVMELIYIIDSFTAAATSHFMVSTGSLAS
jgi:hypothetical protein